MVAIEQVMYEVIYRISKPRWDDGSIPSQVAELASHKGKQETPLIWAVGRNSLYLSCPTRICRCGIDTSPTAIRKAQEKPPVGVKPEFIVHDVTRLDFTRGPFDIALDVGCLHGLGAKERQRYALELTRLMAPGGTLLIWGGIARWVWRASR